MASKLRIVLYIKGNNKPIVGKRAVAFLCQAVGRNVFKLDIPDNWTKLPAESKYRHLSKALPSNYQLFLYREKKGTRKNRSAYVQRLNEPIKWANVKEKINLHEYAAILNPPLQRVRRPEEFQGLQNGDFVVDEILEEEID